MNRFLFLFFFLPFLANGQLVPVHRQSIEYWDKSLGKSVCCDSVYSVNGWLDAGENENADIRFPFLKFTLLNSQRDGLYIEFDGRGTGLRHETTSKIDSVVVEFGNHDKISLVSVNLGIYPLGFNSPALYSKPTLFSERCRLNLETSQKLSKYPVYKIYFYSSVHQGLRGEYLVREKYGDVVRKSLLSLMGQ